MSSGIFATLAELAAHQAQADAAISALQAAPPSGVTKEDLDALATSVGNIGTQLSALQTLVGTPDPAPAG